MSKKCEECKGGFMLIDSKFETYLVDYINHEFDLIVEYNANIINENDYKHFEIDGYMIDQAKEAFISIEEDKKDAQTNSHPKK